MCSNLLYALMIIPSAFLEGHVYQEPAQISLGEVSLLHFWRTSFAVWVALSLITLKISPLSLPSGRVFASNLGVWGAFKILVYNFWKMDFCHGQLKKTSIGILSVGDFSVIISPSLTVFSLHSKLHKQLPIAWLPLSFSSPPNSFFSM